MMIYIGDICQANPGPCSGVRVEAMKLKTFSNFNTKSAHIAHCTNALFSHHAQTSSTAGKSDRCTVVGR